MRAAVLVLLISMSFSVTAQLLIASIPDSLKAGMNEVIIQDHTRFEFESLTKSELTRSYQVAVLNKFANDRNQIQLPYDDFRSIKNVKVVLYDQLGNKVETYHLKDFGDYSEKSFSLASDSRSKYLDITHKQYPFILEVAYTIAYNTSYIFPTWHPQSDDKQSIVNATFAIINQSGYDIRYRELNISADSVIKKLDETRYYWSIKNLKGYKYEPFSSYIDRSPIVYTGPTKFELDGYQGDMTTWENFGKWQWELNQGRNTLTPEQLQPMMESISGATSKIDSIRRVYDYLQANTHYVSIQLGIGGMQPFETGFVHEKKYGDCKALSFYTQSLLESIGIKAYYTWIYGGKSPIKLFTDFPNDYFNHIILTVPLEKDTIWLECTSQSNAFGNLGTFTGNRYGLMIAEDGGHLIKTKSYGLADNIQTTSAKIFLEPDGKGIAQIKREYSGMEISNDGFEWAILESESKQKDWFIDKHDWESMTLSKLEMNQISDEPIPTGGFTAEVEFLKLAKKSGDRLFYKPFVFTNVSSLKLPDVDRQYPIHIAYPFSEVDSIELILPDAYYPEKEIDSKEINSKFGKYQRSVIKKDDSYIFIRKFDFVDGIYPPSDYEEFRNFFKTIRKYDNEKLVLINRT
ncbi:MAG: hypothetical protein ACJA08_000857 [Cyclobacteriaceae bacterium]|jgi:hypothetical protein